MPRRREICLNVDREICLLVEPGMGSAAKILRHLMGNGWFNGDWPAVGEKTISNVMRESRLLDDSGTWSLLDDDPEVARRVIPESTWAFGKPYGRVWLTRAVAAWVGRVCAVADPLPAWAWVFAKAYQWAKARTEDSGGLAVLLMYRIWES